VERVRSYMKNLGVAKVGGDEIRDGMENTSKASN